MKKFTSLFLTFVFILALMPATNASAEDAYSLITDFKPQAETIFEEVSYIDDNGNTVTGTIMHPGITMNQTYLDNMRDMVRSGQEPWKTAFAIYANDSACSKTPAIHYEWGNDYFVNILGPWTKQNNQALDVYVGMRANWDGATAFKQAIMWYITGDDVYRENSMKIIRAWSQIESVQGHKNFRFPMLTYFLSAAAEIFRYTPCQTPELEWTEEDTQNLTRMMELFTNTYDLHTYWMAQHQFCVMGGMGHAIFTNDLKLYNEAVEAALVNEQSGDSGRNGSLAAVMRVMTKNEETGEILPQEEWHVQLAEMGRDAGHSYDDIGGLSTLVQTIYSQGTKVDPVTGEISYEEDAVNPFNFLNDRLLEGTNYLLKYHMGEDVLWTPTVQDGYTYLSINEDGRGRIEPLVGILYNYYKYIEKQDMAQDKFKYIAMVYESNLPEPSHVDYPMAATLLFTLMENMTAVTPSVKIDGIKIKSDVPPQIVNDRVLVPMRAIFEVLGADVQWDDTTKCATAKKANTEIKIIVDNNTAIVNGTKTELDVTAQIINNRTMIPLRFVAEALNANVKWNGDEKVVEIVINEKQQKDEAVIKLDFEDSAKCSVSGTEGYLFGNVEYVAAMDGQGVQLKNGAFINLDKGIFEHMDECTVTSWVKMDEIKQWCRVFDFGSNQSNYIFLSPKASDGYLRVAAKCDGIEDEQVISTNFTIEPDKWYHFALTIGDNTAVLYVDGTEVGRYENFSVKPSALGNTSANFIGKSQYNDPCFDGVVDDFRIYNRSLSSSEIKNITQK